jgi:hypothetical protein
MLREGALHGSPSMVKFYNPPEGTPSDGNLDDAKLSIVLDNKTLYLFNMKDPESPIELAFQDKYGTIVSYDWCAEIKWSPFQCSYRQTRAGAALAPRPLFPSHAHPGLVPAKSSLVSARASSSPSPRTWTTLVTNSTSRATTARV